MFGLSSFSSSSVGFAAAQHPMHCSTHSLNTDSLALLPQYSKGLAFLPGISGSRHSAQSTDLSRLVTTQSSKQRRSPSPLLRLSSLAQRGALREHAQSRVLACFSQTKDAEQWEPKLEAKLAQERIAPYLEQIGLPTPLVRSVQLSAETDNRADIHLKLENLTTTLCFKIRGALNAMLAYHEEGKQFDVAVAASAGNHSQGVALAAKLLGKTALIVMPKYTDQTKVDRTRALGAEVRLVGDSLEESVAYADQLSKSEGCQLIHPYDDKHVIAGQATLGLELLEQMPDLDTVIVPSGGGGLVSGIASVMPDSVRVIGVQTSIMPSLSKSVEKGEVVAVEPKKTIAGGIAVGRAGKLATRICSERHIEMVQIDEGDLKCAVKRMFEEGCLKVEGAAATGPAALYQKKVAFDFDVGEKPKVAIVITGGNIGAELFSECMSAECEV